jgi:hypothetical protein
MRGTSALSSMSDLKNTPPLRKIEYPKYKYLLCQLMNTGEGEGNLGGAGHKIVISFLVTIIRYSLSLLVSNHHVLESTCNDVLVTK